MKMTNKLAEELLAEMFRGHEYYFSFNIDNENLIFEINTSELTIDNNQIHLVLDFDDENMIGVSLLTNDFSEIFIGNYHLKQSFFDRGLLFWETMFSQHVIL